MELGALKLESTQDGALSCVHWAAVYHNKLVTIKRFSLFRTVITESMSGGLHPFSPQADENTRLRLKLTLYVCEHHALP